MESRRDIRTHNHSSAWRWDVGILGGRCGGEPGTSTKGLANLEMKTAALGESGVADEVGHGLGLLPERDF